MYDSTDHPHAIDLSINPILWSHLISSQQGVKVVTQHCQDGINNCEIKQKKCIISNLLFLFWIKSESGIQPRNFLKENFLDKNWNKWGRRR